MNAANDEPLRVLRFWRDLEVFNIPSAPSSRDANQQTKVDTYRRNDPVNNTLPWRLAKYAPLEEFGYVHVVYLGVADTADLSKLLLQGISPGGVQSERERERVAGNGWLAAFVVNELGYPQSESYLPASFAHGVAALRETQTLDNLNARLERSKEEFAQRRHKPLDKPTAEGDCVDPAVAILNWDDLDAELRIARSLLGEAAEDAGIDWRVVVRTSRVRRRYLDDNLRAASDFLNSFYLDDLDRLIEQAEKKQPFGKALSTYLGPALQEGQRVDILTDNSEMARLVSAKRLPGARWPASPKHHLFLAQQAAVSHVISALSGSEGLIGVNGPPGTGKTTLLCDVVAEIVTERARRIAALDQPVALFEDKVIVAGKSFFPLKAGVVAGSSIVVASTNNNAVKNITQELPARKKIASEFDSADYFAEVMLEVFRAQRVLDEDKQPIKTWGAIAAALGNAGNRRSFAKGFFRDEFAPRNQGEAVQAAEGEQGVDADLADVESTEAAVEEDLPPSMKQLLEAASTDYWRYQNEWKNAKQSFLALLSEFEDYRAVLVRAEEAAKFIDDHQPRLDSLKADECTLEQDSQACQQALAQLRETQANQRVIVEGLHAVLMQLRAATPPNLWDRLVALFGRESRRMAALRLSLAESTNALAEASATLAEISKAEATNKAELERLRERLAAVIYQRHALKRELESHGRVLQQGVDTGAKHFPCEQFWALPVEKRHRASIAVGEKLDDLRAKLFLQAVELHRLTVLANAGKFISNLRSVNGMLTGGSRDKLSIEDRPLLWDAFFFVVPVVSTTLASFDRLFLGMGQNSLGWLLIDEAGQATPQSAAGAIWRSQRVVVVGDPLQVEPVFTVPLSLADKLRHRHDVPSLWSPIDESAQTLADRITPFGSWVSPDNSISSVETPQRLWTGMPLRTHLRCDDPMFSVANHIAYAGQMVFGRVDDNNQPLFWDFSSPLGKSAWFDVRSSRVSHPVSEDEISCLIDSLSLLHPAMDSKTSIYVISPFRKVAQACRQRVKEGGFDGVECGTIHTFQGKEAHIVFLVLGTAPGNKGEGARSWAASKPNLLNVAVTRAKCRLYVIGDASQWGGLNYFRELLSALQSE